MPERPAVRNKRKAESSQRKAIVVAGLVQGMSITQVAEETGISSKTISGWRYNDEEFQDMLESAGESLVNAVINDSVEVVRTQIKGMGEKAREILQRSLESDDERLALQAAGMVFRLGDFVNRDVNIRVGVEQQLASLGAGDPAAGD